MSRTAWLTALVFVALPATACACIWDSDTLIQERSRFPGTLELITGKFLRHSPEFYYWRIRDREAKLADGATDPGLYDDLGVAYEMTDQHARALAILATKEKLHPGLYETYSNLGTFHILAGDFEQGLPLIDLALAINPEAHFGREKYQKWLVEYALTRRKEGKVVLPLRPDSAYGTPTFAKFIAAKLGEERLSLPEQQKAVKGVLGMMRFARHDNPLLLEVLADLLLYDLERSGKTDAKALAARALLQASYVAPSAAQEAYRAQAKESLQGQTGRGSAYLELADLEVTFKQELADAAAWSADLKRKELGWIESGADADAEFNKLYATDPPLVAEQNNLVRTSRGLTELWWWLGGSVGVLVVLLIVLCWRLRPRV